MASEIIIKKRFVNKLIKVLTYLESEWGDNVAENFLQKIDTRINMLKKYPRLGAPSNKIPGLRGLLITKHNILYYKIDKNKIVIMNLYDTRSNPVRSNLI